MSEKISRRDFLKLFTTGSATVAGAAFFPQIESLRRFIEPNLTVYTSFINGKNTMAAIFNAQNDTVSFLTGEAQTTQNDRGVGIQFGQNIFHQNVPLNPREYLRGVKGSIITKRSTPDILPISAEMLVYGRSTDEGYAEQLAEIDNAMRQLPTAQMDPATNRPFVYGRATFHTYQDRSGSVEKIIGSIKCDGLPNRSFPLWQAVVNPTSANSNTEQDLVSYNNANFIVAAIPAFSEGSPTPEGPVMEEVTFNLTNGETLSMPGFIATNGLPTEETKIELLQEAFTFMVNDGVKWGDLKASRSDDPSLTDADKELIRKWTHIPGIIFVGARSVPFTLEVPDSEKFLIATQGVVYKDINGTTLLYKDDGGNFKLIFIGIEVNELTALISNHIDIVPLKPSNSTTS